MEGGFLKLPDCGSSEIMAWELYAKLFPCELKLARYTVNKYNM